MSSNRDVQMCKTKTRTLQQKHSSTFLYFIFSFYFLCLMQELTQVFSRQHSSCLSKLINSLLALQPPGTEKSL